jgi:hypothetical protein
MGKRAHGCILWLGIGQGLTLLENLCAVDLDQARVGIFVFLAVAHFGQIDESCVEEYRRDTVERRDWDMWVGSPTRDVAKSTAQVTGGLCT